MLNEIGRNARCCDQYTEEKLTHSKSAMNARLNGDTICNRPILP